MLKQKELKVSKEAFDVALEKLIKAPALPLAKLVGQSKKRKGKK